MLSLKFLSGLILAWWLLMLVHLRGTTLIRLRVAKSLVTGRTLSLARFLGILSLILRVLCMPLLLLILRLERLRVSTIRNRILAPIQLTRALLLRRKIRIRIQLVVRRSVNELLLILLLDILLVMGLL
jgi:hypothetical protein